MSTLNYFLDWIWGGVVALIGLVWTQHNKRIDDLEKMMLLGDKINHDELKRQQDSIDRLGDKIDVEGKISAARHIELLNALHNGLSGKADK